MTQMISSVSICIMQKLIGAKKMRPGTVWAALSAALVLGGLSLLGGARTPGYNPLRHWVSHLALAPKGWLYSLAIAVAGVLWGLVAWGLTSVSRELRRVRVAIAAAGVGLLLSAVFPTDPGLGFPPASVAAVSFAGAIHRAAGLVVFGSLIFAPFAFGRWLARRAQHPALRRGSYAAAGIAAGAWLACSLLGALDFSGAYSPAPSGLFERVALMAGALWIASMTLLRSSWAE